MIKWITKLFSILISGQMFPKSIASCSFSEMNLVPHYYFQGQKGPIYWALQEINCLFNLVKPVLRSKTVFSTLKLFSNVKPYFQM